MSGSSFVSLVAGVTLTTGLSLVVSRLAHRSRAALRHVLLAGSFAVLAMLPIASIVVPAVPVRVPMAAASGAIAPAVELITGAAPLDVPATATARPEPPVASRASWLPALQTLLAAVWLVGAAISLLPIIIGLCQVRALRRSALPWPQGQSAVARLASSLKVKPAVEMLRHESMAGPMTSGALRPAILLPMDAEQWPAENLERAIVHELEHVRRRDWLSQCLARVICAGYWFHPLVWIARQQLGLEAERACDDAVLEHSEATGYADQLVGLANRLSAAHRQPLLAMANRRDLAARVRSLLDGGLQRGRAGKAAIAATCLLSVVLAVTMSPWRVVAAGQTPPAPQASAAAARFDAVSVSPCDPNASPTPGAGGGRGSLPTPSPGRFRLDCLSVDVLINWAYVAYANGHPNPPSARPIIDRLAGPDWIHSERFTIEARLDPATPAAVMQGPVLQAVLEDRFKLKMRRETRDVPIYELVVSEGGSKVTPFAPGACVPWDWSVDPQPPLKSGQRRCTAGSELATSGKWVQRVEAMTLDDWTASFGLRFERPIVNKTGIAGLQTFTFEYSGRAEDFGAEIRNQLGLDLRRATRPREFLIVDRVERPTPDTARATLNPPAR